MIRPLRMHRSVTAVTAVWPISIDRIKRAWGRRSPKWDVPKGDMLSIGNSSIVLCRCLALTIL